MKGISCQNTEEENVDSKSARGEWYLPSFTFQVFLVGHFDLRLLKLGFRLLICLMLEMFCVFQKRKRHKI